jgi:hypothetical protein
MILPAYPTNLKKETTDHADRESPSLVLNAEPKLHDQKQAKSSSIVLRHQPRACPVVVVAQSGGDHPPTLYSQPYAHTQNLRPYTHHTEPYAFVISCVL